LLVSVGLHAALLLVPILGRFHATVRPPEPASLPNSVAMSGNSIEVEAPTPDFAAAPAAPPPAPEPVDVNALPPEPAHAAERIADPDAAPAPKPAPLKLRTKPIVPKPKPATPTEHSRLPTPSSTSAAGADAPTGAPAAGTFGQEGLAPGVRRLGYAFTRAIPAATPSDEAWRELPAGHVGTIRIELQVDENNRLGELKRWQARPGEPPPPAVLERMVERTLLLLRAGQFALSGSNQPGSERLTIDVTLRDEAAEEEGSDNVVNKGFDGATPGHPGRAHFRYGNGRTFEARVTIVSSGR
jgi:hypothetical protein